MRQIIYTNETQKHVTIKQKSGWLVAKGYIFQSYQKEPFYETMISANCEITIAYIEGKLTPYHTGEC